MTVKVVRPLRTRDRDSVDVLIVGAGPVGLTMANILGGHGVRTRVIDSRSELIDYPRGVGLDDESLRGFQGIGLAEGILPHTVPNQIMRFVNGKGGVIAEIAPTGEPFGWPRRNGFVQPLVDAELLKGLERYEKVDVQWSRRLESFSETSGGIAATVEDEGGGTSVVDARYLIGCDGGRSATRHLMGASFDGTTSSTRWLVIDVRNDPLGAPNIYVGADPKRPYVSVSIAHGIRRFEFMVLPGESDERAEDPEFVQAMLAPFVPNTSDLDIIRQRVYTHHSRIAGAFRKGRVFLAGDAAHLMPVWQGQGYNSGIRDAVNLGWKLAAVINGVAEDALLDTYDVERRGHAGAMIDLSTRVGKIISPTNRTVALARDLVFGALSNVPALKRYIMEMRFKPMPRYERGAVVHAPGTDARTSPVGRLFIQPKVDTRLREDVRLDDVLGPWFAIASWNNDPVTLLGPEQFEVWKRLGAHFISFRPNTQLNWPDQDHPDVEIVGDRSGALKAWFDEHEESTLFLRPDRCVAGACIAQNTASLSRSLTTALSLTTGVRHAPSALLPVAQPTA